MSLNNFRWIYPGKLKQITTNYITLVYNKQYLISFYMFRVLYLILFTAALQKTFLQYQVFLT